HKQLFFFSSRRRHTRSDRDWSSDVCSSDLENRLLASPASLGPLDSSSGQEDVQAFTPLAADKLRRLLANVELMLAYELVVLAQEIGRASCRERVEVHVVGGVLKKKKYHNEN